MNRVQTGRIVEDPKLMDDATVAVRYEHDSSSSETNYYNFIGKKISEEDFLEGWGVSIPETISAPEKDKDMETLNRRHRAEIEDLTVRYESQISDLRSEIADRDAKYVELIGVLGAVSRRMKGAGIDTPELDRWISEQEDVKTLEPVETEAVDVNETTVEPVATPIESGGRVHRVGNWLGERLTGRKVVEEDGQYYVQRSGRRRIVVDEVAASELTESNKRAGFLTIGGLVVGSVVGTLFWEYVVEPYMLHKHGMPPSGISGQRALNGHGWQYVGPKGTPPAGEHLQFYNDGQGNHAFAIDSPSGYGIEGRPGNYSYHGPDGRVVENLQWKASGSLADGPSGHNTIQRIAKAFPELKIKVGRLFYSDHTGPGEHGWVRHTVTSLRVQ